jgi:hypothetical protein
MVLSAIGCLLEPLKSSPPLAAIPKVRQQPSQEGPASLRDFGSAARIWLAGVRQLLRARFCPGREMADALTKRVPLSGQIHHSELVHSTACQIQSPIGRCHHDADHTATGTESAWSMKLSDFGAVSIGIYRLSLLTLFEFPNAFPNE